MHTFYKTELGFRTLKLRDLQLNARQRRLLVLIGTDDFHTLNAAMKQRIAEPELLQQLMDLGLIVKEAPDAVALHQVKEEADIQPQILTQHSEIHTALQHSSSAIAEDIQFKQQNFQPEPVIINAQENNQLTADFTPHFSPLAFDELKQFMMQHLQQYCGLMAKQLMLKIQAAEQISQLKQCQMQWITLLQESRIVPQLLNNALHQVNLSMRKLQSA
ncbi:hypothetical protein [Acinetobacter pragensis]|uniref:hypothetical protein n=1 Tax=Acinetobacter pragensis TaxID=1806892 RepID=UPI00333FAB6B